MNIKGLRIAIFGLGRSGLSVGRACLALGAKPFIFDQSAEDDLQKPELIAEAYSAGLQVAYGWNGELSPNDFDMLVVNPAVDYRNPILQSLKTQGMSIISENEFAYRISKAPIVAITGTNGKSTTTVMTYLCLKSCGIDAILCGNIYGSGYPEVPLTEAALTSTKDQVLVAEVSSFGLEWTEDFQPVAAAITNIWPDHQNRYNDFNDYAQTKMRIFRCMDSDDVVVVKANDPVVIPPGGSTTGTYRPRIMRLGVTSAEQKADLPLVLTFGATSEHARVEERDIFILNKKILLSELPFSEAHNYTNACTAALLSVGVLRYLSKHKPESPGAKLLAEAENEERSLRLEKKSVYDLRKSEENPFLVLPSAVVEGLKQFQGLENRMEYLGEKDGIRVINNSMCTNPDAVIKSVQAVKDPTHILIGGVNKGLDFGPLKNYLANRRNMPYLFGRDRHDIDGMLGGGHPEVPTMEEAFKLAVDKAQKGEIIMLAPGCASNDQFRDFVDRGNVFRNIAKAWISN